MYSNLLNAGLGHLCHPHNANVDDALDVFGVPNRSFSEGHIFPYENSYRAPFTGSTTSSWRTDESGHSIRVPRQKRSLPILKPTSSEATPFLSVTSSRVEYLPAILITPSLEDSSPLINDDDDEEYGDAISVASSSSSSSFSTTSSFLFLKPMSTRSHRNFSINTSEPPSLHLSSPPLSPSYTSCTSCTCLLSVHSDSSDCTTDRRNKQLDALAILEGRTAQAAKPETSFTSFLPSHNTKRYGFIAQSPPGAFHVHLAGHEIRK